MRRIPEESHVEGGDTECNGPRWAVREPQWTGHEHSPETMRTLELLEEVEADRSAEFRKKTYGANVTTITRVATVVGRSEPSSHASLDEVMAKLAEVGREVGELRHDVSEIKQAVKIRPSATVLPVHLTADLRWTKPCEAMFEELARSDPERLIQMIVSGTLSPPDLTFAAEHLGEIDSVLARPLLLGLLAHAAPVVREGAIYGLVAHLNSVVIDRLRGIAAMDPSPGVRTAANGVLEDV